MSRPRSPNALHRWSTDDRLTLCLLKSIVGLTRKSLTSLFNKIHETTLAREGFRSGLKRTTLDAQFSEIKSGGKGYNIWLKVTETAPLDFEKVFPRITQKIEQAARFLRLPVRYGRSFRVSSLSRHPRLNRRRRAMSTPAMSITESLAPESSDQELSIHEQEEWPASRLHPMADIPIRPTYDEPTFRDFLSATPQPPELRSNLDAQGNTTRPHPTLLFRAYTPEHQFRARKFQDFAISIPKPPPIASDEFRGLVWPHLQRNRSYHSPYISMAQNARNALRRIELGYAEDCNYQRRLAIFVFNELQLDANTNYGPDAGPILVRSLFGKYEISDLPDGYLGCGEVRNRIRQLQRPSLLI